VSTSQIGSEYALQFFFLQSEAVSFQYSIESLLKRNCEFSQKVSQILRRDRMPLRSLSFRGVPQKAQETLASRWSQFQYLKDWPSKALAISISQASLITLLELGLLGATLNGLNQLFGSFSGTSGIILIYFVLFILAQWFQALLSLDAFLTKNTMEAVAVQVFNVCVTVYAIVRKPHCLNSSCICTPMRRTNHWEC
jgi:hypothetical protein